MPNRDRAPVPAADHLIVLAGGRATRLGPLAANLSKALVPVGQRPVLARQICDMRIRNVTVVTSAETRPSVASMLQQSGLNDLYDMQLVDQSFRVGPGSALEVGLSAIDAGSVLILFADTLIDPREIPNPITDPWWIGVSHTHERRSWCYMNEHGFTEGIPNPASAIAFIGALRVPDVGQARSVVSRVVLDHAEHMSGCEVPMAPILNALVNEFGASSTSFPSWLDVGDTKALARARRTEFLSRGHHRLELDDLGVLTKHGASLAQRRFLADVPDEARPLFPRVYDRFNRDEPLRMDYVDLPSLGELWLYWPGTTDMWTHILETLLQRLDDHLWRRSFEATHEGIGNVERARRTYITKTVERLTEVHVAVSPGVGRFLELVKRELVDTARSRPQGLIHGDLNLGNVLWSLSTGTFKLLDPRGDWGDGTGIGDVIYELAKLRYDYRDGFSAICHGLYRERSDGTFVVRRSDERTVTALDEVITRYAPLRLVAMAEATLFLSALPLHPPEQRGPLFQQAHRLIEEIVG